MYVMSNNVFSFLVPLPFVSDCKQRKMKSRKKYSRLFHIKVLPFGVDFYVCIGHKHEPGTPAERNNDRLLLRDNDTTFKYIYFTANKNFFSKKSHFVSFLLNSFFFNFSRSEKLTLKDEEWVNYLAYFRAWWYTD